MIIVPGVSEPRMMVDSLSDQEFRTRALAPVEVKMTPSLGTENQESAGGVATVVSTENGVTVAVWVDIDGWGWGVFVGDDGNGDIVGVQVGACNEGVASWTLSPKRRTRTIIIMPSNVETEQLTAPPLCYGVVSGWE